MVDEMEASSLSVAVRDPGPAVLFRRHPGQAKMEA